MFEAEGIPLVDISSFADDSDPASRQHVAQQIQHACETVGFFYIVGHGVPVELQNQLEELSHRFFQLNVEDKMLIGMEHAGVAWRGYFPVGDELTSGKPDQKEGLYFGSELGPDHPKVKSKTPLHGANLFPELSDFREVVLEYMAQLTIVGHHVMRAIALSLELDESWFYDHYTADPLVLFRIFHYPALGNDLATSGEPSNELWSVGEHTDYGLITILKQDQVGGLQIKQADKWIPAAPLENAFVCNIGDMLDRMTSGRYRSTPHRVLNRSAQSRLSFPFFFDPNFDAKIRPIDEGLVATDDRTTRWDGANVHDFHGTYGEYILEKVAKVFPDQSRTHLDGKESPNTEG